MSISSTIKDNYNNPIISNIELLQRNKDETDKSNFNSSKFFLRTGRPGHLFLKPNYTAFTKTNLGSIPTKLEKTLIKTKSSKPISTFINNTISSFNKKKELKPIETEEKDIRKYTTSFSSKGFGVGFVSKVSRFGESLSGYKPGPADYSPERNLTLLSKVENSTFGKSFFKKKTSMSLSCYNNNFSNQTTKRSSTSSKSKNYTDINNSENIPLEKNKGSYFFNSTSDRFNGSIFGSKNRNPGPGKYFFDNNNIIVKEPEKLSSGFVEPKKKMTNPIKFYGLNKNEKKKFGYHLSNKMKNGKIIYIWKGNQNTNDEIIMHSKKFNNNSNISLANNSTKITSMVSNNNNSSNLPSIYFGDKKSNINYSKNEYISISPENISWLNKSDENKIKTKYENNLKKMLKYKKKDYFSLSSPRWDQGFFHDNATHFQVPGPAYYTPKTQNTKKSFNLNNKDFIFTNSLPFKNDDYYSNSSVLI